MIKSLTYFTFRTIVPLVSVDAVALAQVTGPVAGTFVRTRGRNVFGFRNPEHHSLRPEIVVVHGQKPPARVQVLYQSDVDDHGVLFDNVGRPAVQSVFQSAALDELGKIVLRYARGHVPTTVHGKVGSPG